MRLLALDSSGPVLSAAAADKGEVRAFHRQELGRGHAERILPMIETVLAEAGWRWSEIQLVAVTLGPGNFTGLRAGVAVARALSLTLGCPTLGVGTLEVVAQAATGAQTLSSRPVLVVMDARRDEVYSQRFDRDLMPLTPPELLARVDLVVDGAWLLTGDAAASLAERLQGEHRIVPATPDAQAVAALAWRRLEHGAVPAMGTALRPVYIRPPDARPSAGAPLVAALDPP